MTDADLRNSDIVVVGGGGAGLAAAVAAAEGGAKVTLLERRPTVGGTTVLSVGSFTAADTDFQRRRRIADNPEHLVEDMWKFDEDLLAGDAPELRRRYAIESARTLKWLVGHGVAFAGPYPEPPHRVPRMHNVIPSSRAYVARLHEAAHRLGVDIQTDADVTELVVDGEVVVGAKGNRRGEPFTITARRGMVLATGDFSGNDEMRRDHLGSAAASALPINPEAVGGGHLLAASVGAQLVRMDQLFGPQLRFPPPSKRGFIDRLPMWRWLCRLEGMVVNAVPPAMLRPLVKSLLVSHMSPTDALFKEGAVLVNSTGTRVVTEPSPAAALAMEPDRRGYLVLDERVAKVFDSAPNHVSTAPGIAFAYFSDYQKGRPDLVHRADNIDALAEILGVKRAALESSVSETRLAGPYVAMGPVFSMLTVTEGAVSVDAHNAVLRSDGSPIKGLFAVGAVGQGGMLLKGHGHHIGWAMTSGRLVGDALSKPGAEALAN